MLKINIINNIEPIRKILRLHKLLVTFLLIIVSQAMNAKGSGRLFSSDEVISLELRTDFKSILKTMSDTPEYHEGELVYLDENNENVKLNIKVMARGNFRRNPDYCSFPPLFINFKKGEVKETLFDSQNKLKLVTPCQDEKEVIEEYLIYKLYNEVTDFSFRVRLVKVLYYDTATEKKLFERYSFFIEDKDHVAERNGAVARDTFLTPFDIDQENFKKMAFFQYIIGNRDWYVSSRKNIVIMQPEDPMLKPVAVPYDFDLSGFVDAYYSKPQGVPEHLLKDKRIYKGICYSEEEFNEIFSFYTQLKPRFESVINNTSLVSKSDKKQMLRYIDHFYTVIRNRNMIESEFLSSCETKKTYNIAEK